MKTKFILHGGETGHDNESNRNFYKSWVADFKPDYKPTILLIYFARTADRDESGAHQDIERFNLHTNNHQANFVVANRDMKIFTEQVKQADVLYFRGGLPDRALRVLDSLKTPFSDLIKGKIVAGSSAGVMLLSTYSSSNNKDYSWRPYMGILPIATFVHWSPEFQGSLDEFKTNHSKENLEYILLPVTEFAIKEFDL